MEEERRDLVFFALDSKELCVSAHCLVQCVAKESFRVPVGSLPGAVSDVLHEQRLMTLRVNDRDVVLVDADQYLHLRGAVGEESTAQLLQ